MPMIEKPSAARSSMRAAASRSGYLRGIDTSRRFYGSRDQKRERRCLPFDDAVPVVGSRSFDDRRRLLSSRGLLPRKAQRVHEVRIVKLAFDYIERSEMLNRRPRHTLGFEAPADRLNATVVASTG